MYDRVDVCPSDDELAELLADNAVTARQRLREHLDHCEACRSLMGVVGQLSEVEATSAGEPASGTWHERSDPLGQQLGRYRIDALLGAGGMGWVYHGIDMSLGRAVAIKVLRPDRINTAGLRERLRLESRVMGRLNHPAIVRIYDVGDHEGRVWIAMEYINGTTLGPWRHASPRAWRELAPLFAQIAHGLAAAHAQGIVHRDVKPDNIFIEQHAGRPPRAVLGDFGIAAHSGALPLASVPAGPGDDQEVALTLTGQAIGTPAYMAPEQFRAEATGPAADVFALAACIWEAIFGTRPFPGRNFEEIYAALSAPPVTGPGAMPRDVPDEVMPLLRRALRPSPAERPTMLQLARTLSPPQRRATRWPLALGLASMAVALGLGAGLRRPRNTAASCAQQLPGLLAPLSAVPSRGPETLPPPLGDQLATTYGALGMSILHACPLPSQRLPLRVASCLTAQARELAYASQLVQAATDEGRLALRGHVLVASRSCDQETLGPLGVPSPHDLWPPSIATRLEGLVALHRVRQGDASALATLQTPLSGHVAGLDHERRLWLGLAYTTQGELSEARNVLHEVANAAGTHGEPRLSFFAWLALAATHDAFSPTPTRAVEYVRYAEAAWETIGKPAWGAPHLAYAQANAAMATGHPSAARAAFARLRLTASVEFQGLALEGLGDIAMLVDDVPSARGHYGEAHRLRASPTTAAKLSLATTLDRAAASPTADAPGPFAAKLASQLATLPTASPAEAERLIQALSQAGHGAIAAWASCVYGEYALAQAPPTRARFAAEGYALLRQLVPTTSMVRHRCMLSLARVTRAPDLAAQLAQELSTLAASEPAYAPLRAHARLQPSR